MSKKAIESPASTSTGLSKLVPTGSRSRVAARVESAGQPRAHAKSVMARGWLPVTQTPRSPVVPK